VTTDPYGQSTERFAQPDDGNRARLRDWAIAYFGFSDIVGSGEPSPRRAMTAVQAELGTTPPTLPAETGPGLTCTEAALPRPYLSDANREGHQPR
jgi:hypothetical protein